MADMKHLQKETVDYIREEGACAVGFATTESLAGGPPSADLSYVLEGARSAITFALPLDPDGIEKFLSKQDHATHQRDNVRTNTISSGIALNIAKFLDQRGHKSYPIPCNNVYRDKSPMSLIPDISLRYLAVASGLGTFGLSGNVLTKDYGSAVVLGGIVTTAELEPTAPLSKEDSYCDDCRLCMSSCVSKMMDPEEMEHVTLGENEYTYSKRRGVRCEFVCGGFTGMHESGKWSTWSPGRFNVPESDNELMQSMMKGVMKWNNRPQIKGGFLHPKMGKKINLTCGNCSLVCHPDKKERARRFKLLTSSGCVVQGEDGSLKAYPPDEAAKRVADMTPERRNLYEDN